MFRRLLLLIIAMTATGLFAQSSDTLYIYETVIEYDTLVTRDTTYIHDTIHLTYPEQGSINKKGLREKKSDRKEKENSSLLEELFQGFHLGYTGQFDLTMPAQVTEDPHLMGVPYAGGHAGLEFSWHFARWFGVSAALNYGTTGALRFKYEWQDGNPETIKRNFLYGTGLSMPIKIEFHYPISPKAWAVVDAGVRIRMPWNTFIYGYNRDHSALDTEYQYHLDYVESLSEDNPLIVNYNYIDRDILNVDVLAGVGMYHRLRNNDFIRWNIGFNVALREFAIGSFVHRIYRNPDMHGSVPVDDYQDILGDFSLRNHFFYAQVAYIHTFSKSKHRSETAPYALKYGNNKMYNHEFKLEVSDWFGITLFQNHQNGRVETAIDPTIYGPARWFVTVTPQFSFNYHYRVTPWFWVGVMLNYAHYYDQLLTPWDNFGGQITYSLPSSERYFSVVGILPDIRFSYFNRPHVTLYSAISLGFNAYLKEERISMHDGTITDHPTFFSAYHVTLFGVKAGGSHWFGSFELGAGYNGIVSFGVGYEF